MHRRPVAPGCARLELPLTDRSRAAARPLCARQLCRRDDACRGTRGGVGWAPRPTRSASIAAPRGRALDIEQRVYRVVRCMCAGRPARSRMEAIARLQNGPTYHPGTATRWPSTRFDRTLPDDPLNAGAATTARAEALRSVGGGRALQLSVRAGGGRSAPRWWCNTWSSRPQRHGLERPAADRRVRRCRAAAGVLNLSAFRRRGRRA